MISLKGTSEYLYFCCFFYSQAILRQCFGKASAPLSRKASAPVSKMALSRDVVTLVADTPTVDPNAFQAAPRSRPCSCSGEKGAGFDFCFLRELL